MDKMMFFSFLAAFIIGSNVFSFIQVDLSGSIFKHPIFYLMSFFFALCGAGWATINVNSYPMVVEMNKNSNIGKYTGYYYTASMSAQIVAPILSGFLYDLFGMRSMFFSFGTLFVALSFVTMFLVKHGDAKAERVDALSALGGGDDD